MMTPQPLIAIVDDEESIRRALSRLLRSVGLQAVAYASGAEFLTALPLQPPSCVVLDLHMPGMSGIDVQEQLARSWPDLPVIVVTGQHSTETETQVQVCHPVAYLLKPLDDELLLGAIRAATDAGRSPRVQAS
jgi:FixJ family two-component response regulator